VSDPDPPQRDAPSDAPPDGPDASLGGGFLFGRVLGIPILVSPWWFVIAALITMQFAPAVAEHFPTVSRSGSYLIALVFVLLLYGSVLLHELGHALVARALGLPVRRIVLQLLGGVSEITEEPDTAGREYLVSIAGPMISVLLTAVGFAVLFELPGDTVAKALVGEFAVANGLVAVFNLLPGLPLDGGRVLRAAVWHVSGDQVTGTRAAGLVGRVLAVLVALSPVILYAVFGRPVTWFESLYVLLIATFIWGSATASLRQASLRTVVPRLSARALTRRALPVRGDLPLAEAVRRAQAASARALVVVDGSGRPAGLVSEAQVAVVPEERRPWLPVADLSRPLEDGLTIDADLAGDALLEALQTTPATEYLVVERNGAVFGVLAQVDLLHVLQAGRRR
jgi:Zn-dependent protease